MSVGPRCHLILQLETANYYLTKDIIKSNFESIEITKYKGSISVFMEKYFSTNFHKSKLGVYLNTFLSYVDVIGPQRNILCLLRNLG